MHDGEKIKKIRAIKAMKQLTLARAVGISTQAWRKHEDSGNIPDEWWPALERELGLKKKKILAIDKALKGYL